MEQATIDRMEQAAAAVHGVLLAEYREGGEADGVLTIVARAGIDDTEGIAQGVKASLSAIAIGAGGEVNARIYTFDEAYEEMMQRCALRDAEGGRRLPDRRVVYTAKTMPLAHFGALDHADQRTLLAGGCVAVVPGGRHNREKQQGRRSDLTSRQIVATNAEVSRMAAIVKALPGVYFAGPTDTQGVMRVVLRADVDDRNFHNKIKASLAGKVTAPISFHVSRMQPDT